MPKTNPAILKAVKKYYYKNKNEILKKKKLRNIPYLLDRERIAKLFKNECFICKRKYGSYFVFHHLWYEKNSQTYINRNDKLALEEVKSYPERFMLLCRACHIHLEYYLYDEKTWENFKKAYELSKNCRKLSNYKPLSKHL